MPEGTGAGGALQVQRCLADGGQGRAVEDTGDVEEDDAEDEEVVPYAQSIYKHPQLTRQGAPRTQASRGCVGVCKVALQS